MRILLVADRRSYVNPTRELLIDALRVRPEIVLHGRGYTRIATDLATLEREHGRFDLIAIDAAIYFHRGTANACRYTGSTDQSWPRDLFDCEKPILVLNVLDDVHGATKEQFECLQRDDVFVLSAATGWQFFKPTGHEHEREPWLSPSAHAFTHPGVINERYLLFPHCIDESEFMRVREGRPRYDIAIHGALYHFRRKAIAAIEEYNGQNPGGFRLVTSDRLQNYLGVLSSRFGIGTSLFRRRFMRWTNASLVALTCAGSVGYPIRKFFEIPAYGSVLVAEFFHDPAALGFVDGANCYVLDVAHLDLLQERLSALRGDLGLAMRIARQGQEMVRECHTVGVRVRQFLEIAAALARRSLKTIRWERGRPLIIEKMGA